MNMVALRCSGRRLTWLGRGLSLLLFVPLLEAGGLHAAVEQPAPPTREPVAGPVGPVDASVPETAVGGDEIITLAAYNAKADRIEDFGVRVRPAVRTTYPKTAVGIMFSRYVPMVWEVVPNTAAAKAGLQPGDRILKSEGRSLVVSVFSSIQMKQWYATQKRKWAEVAEGKTGVTWTLEVESPATKAVRTVKLVVPSPPPHWGSSLWRKPEGRTPAVVPETGPLAERARAVLDNGIASLLSERYARLLGLDFRGGIKSDFASGREPAGVAWHFKGGAGEGSREIFVTQFRGRTDVFFHTRSQGTGVRYYLTSPSGVLEKAWLVPFPGKERELSLEEARLGFEHERDFWATKVQPGTGRWPFDVKPGFDAQAIFARLAPAMPASATEAAAVLNAEFLKLRPATEAERALFTAAWGRLGTEHDQWAYTETARGVEDTRQFVTRVDPSRPEAERCVLLSVDGKPPTAEDVERWRDDGRDRPKPLGDLPPLKDLVDVKNLRVFAEEAGAVIFELPMRGGGGEFSPDKFQAHIRVNKTHRAVEAITVKLRESVRVTGLIKVTDAGMEARFQTLDPALAPQPVWLKEGGGVRVLLVKVSRASEATRTEYRRVGPAERTETEAGMAK